MSMFVPTVHYLEPTCVRQRPSFGGGGGGRRRSHLGNNSCSYSNGSNGSNSGFVGRPDDFFSHHRPMAFMMEPDMDFYAAADPFEVRRRVMTRPQVQPRLVPAAQPRPAPFRARLDLEGFAPEDVTVQFEKAKRRLDVRAASKRVGEDGGTSERSMARSVDVPPTCDVERLTVEMDRNGILTVEAPALGSDDASVQKTTVEEDHKEEAKNEAKEEAKNEAKEEAKENKVMQEEEKATEDMLLTTTAAEVHNDAKQAEKEEEEDKATTASSIEIEDCGVDEEADSVTSSKGGGALDPDLDHVLEEIVPDFSAAIDVSACDPASVRVQLEEESGVLRISAKEKEQAAKEDEHEFVREFSFSLDKYDPATLTSGLSKEGVLTVSAEARAS